ncbi:MAG: tetratricopeptide repeat protein, partial [Myxococcota bacterium]
MSEEDLSEPNEIETVEEDADAAPGDVESEVPRELTDADRAKLSELDEEIAKFEGQKRWSDVVRRVLAKVDIVVDQAEQVALLRQAGMLYLERSSNQAEAIKCFERLLKLEPRNTGALTRLEQMYEKRRDWEKLVRVRQQAAELMDELDRPLVYLEIAKLASQRLRKPQVCIELWQQVLGVDSENPEALEELSTLYERSREWEPLAKVLEQISQGERNEATLKQQLQKLGTIYADKIGDDSAAVHAFQRLLELDPEDRRAQEQL